MSLLLLDDGDDVYRSPVISGFGWEAIVDDVGFRFTEFWNDAVPGGIQLGIYSMGYVISHQHPASPHVEDLEYSADMTIEAIDLSDPDDWTITLGSSVRSGGTPAYTWETRATVDQSAGVQAMTLRPKIDCAAWAAPTTVLKGCAYIFVIEAPGDPANCRVMVPGYQSEVWGWNDSRLLAGKSWHYPGSPWIGDVYGLPYDEPSGSLGAFTLDGTLDGAPVADLYFWDDEPDAISEKVGICFRFTDSVGAGRVISMTNTGSGQIILTVIFAAQDGSIGVNNASDTDFADGIQMRPMVGEDYDATKWCGEQEEAEGWAWAAAGAIGMNPNLSTLAEEMVMLGYASGGHIFEDFGLYHEAYTRLAAKWGLGFDEIAVQVYNYAAARPPHVEPFRDTAAYWLGQMHDAGISIIMYCDPLEPWNLIDGYGVDSSSPIWASLDRTRVGYTIPGVPLDLGNLPISNGNETAEGDDTAAGIPAVGVKYHFSPYDLVANEAYLDEQETSFNTNIGTKRRGAYSDTAGVEAPPPADNATHSSAARGFGSTLYMAAQRDFHLKMRERMGTGGPGGLDDPALFAEFTNPQSVVGIFDLSYINPIYPAGGTFYGYGTLQPSVKYGRHIRLGTYLWWGSGPGPAWYLFYVPGWATQGEIHSYTMAYAFMSGMVMPLQTIFQDPSDPYGYVRLPDEPGYLDYVTETPYYDFIEDLYINQKDFVKRLQTEAYRLRELESGIYRRGHDYLIDGTNPQVPAAKAVSGVWHFPVENEMVVVYANWSRNDGNPVTVTTTDVITEEGWPEITLFDRDVWLWDWRTNTAEVIGRKFAGEDYEITITCPPGFVGTVVFTPINQASQLIDAADADLGIWENRLTTAQHEYIAQGAPGEDAGSFVTLGLSLITTAGFNGGGPSLDFSDEDNSQYLVL